MSNKKGNGKQCKDGKGNSVVKEPKFQQPKGPKPDFKPHVKTSETFQTLAGAWNGYCGLVMSEKMQFRFFTEASESGEKIKRVRLVSAPIKTALSDLGDYATSIKLESVKKSSFVSDFKKGDPRYEVQSRLWKYWSTTFWLAGLRISHQKGPSGQTAHKDAEYQHKSKPQPQQVVGFLGLNRHKARLVSQPGATHGDKSTYFDNQMAA